MPKLHDDIRTALATPQYSSPYELKKLRGILAHDVPSKRQTEMARDMIDDNADYRATGTIRSVNGEKPRKLKAKAKSKPKPAVFTFDADDAPVPASPLKAAKNKMATEPVTKADYARPLPLPSSLTTPTPKATVAPTAFDISTATITAIAVRHEIDQGCADDIVDRATIARIAMIAERLLITRERYLYGYEIGPLQRAAKVPSRIWAGDVRFLVSAEMLAPYRSREVAPQYGAR